MPWILLLFGLWCVALAGNVWYPTWAPGWRATLSFMAGLLVGDLPLHHIAVGFVGAVVLVSADGLEAIPGKLGLALVVASWVSLWRAHQVAERAGQAMQAALVAGLGAGYENRLPQPVGLLASSTVDWGRIALPWRIGRPGVERIRDLRYGRATGLDLRLDLYRGPQRQVAAPVMLFLHGGGWVTGTKNLQGLPLLHDLAAEGWLCVSADYRLSPHATFPDHLVDVKRAIAWIRAEISRYGGDPSFLVVSGGSAGGHLATLAGLTANDPEYQPGFESVDTSVQAVVPFFGVFDLLDRHHTMRNPDLSRLLETRVLKASPEEAPEIWESGSPIARLHADAPPMFVVHGEHDSLIPIGHARRFVAAAHALSHSPVLYAEIPAAQHGFGNFRSVRAELVNHGVIRFLTAVRHGLLPATGPSLPDPAETGRASFPALA